MKKITQNRSWVIATLTIIITLTIMLVALYANSVTVKVNSLNLRTGPAITYSIKEKVHKGERLQVIDRKNDWIKVIAHHKDIGWVASWLVDNPKANSVTRLSEATIAIDPGHGGSDSGALSTTGQEEKKYTLIFATKLAKTLRAKGARVIMTRDSNKTVALADRPKIAIKNSANLFISIHFDSSDVANDASGVTTYYYHPGQSKTLANSVNSQLTNLPLPNRGAEFGNFLVVRDISIPSILIEGGYINNDGDFKQISSASYQQQYVNDVTNGIYNYFKDNN
ncbi:N-acetylmuramoyl-L-alanine amidase [Lentilactobacillus sp. SPB1-3]|uniref:N-acetylmuramoyl-L-alanine amidase n=1 Tax=Lentilactobacillus terminaliae TaxID=3003483 RepID=A0ACD5DC53_9LACO|nr:N-acetylmuramoyl-L-alanine amidase [Lentilactobacillus sp. SPB1-3]MCZ0977289.1 N-acetylmuramoyl-L-alanine amidase [Lentilactobacillus sp. SPB1-3]